MNLRHIYLSSALLLSGCAHMEQQALAQRQATYNQDVIACDRAYGFSYMTQMSWGEREIPKGFDGWVDCRNNAYAKQFQGTNDYGLALEEIAYNQQQIALFKAGRITRTQMRANATSKHAEIVQRSIQQAQAIGEQRAKAFKAVMQNYVQNEQTSVNAANQAMMNHQIQMPKQTICNAGLGGHVICTTQ